MRRSIFASLPIAGLALGSCVLAQNPDFDPQTETESGDGPSPTSTSSSAIESTEGPPESTTSADPTTGEGMVAGCADSWWNEAWSNRVEFNFRVSSLQGVVADVPIPVRIDGAAFVDIELPTTPDGVVFVTEDGAVVGHEVEVWNPDGVSVVWVRVPEVGSSDQIVWMYWGGPSLPSESVWPKEFAAVWHLGETATDEATATVHLDSTDAGLSGNQLGNASVSGAFGSGQRFDGIDDAILVPDEGNNWVIGDGGLDGGTGSLTITAWVFDEHQGSISQPVVWKGGGGMPGYAIETTRDDRTVDVYMSTPVSVVEAYELQASSDEIVENEPTWHHIAGVVERTSEGDQLFVFVDGALPSESVFDNRQVGALASNVLDFGIGGSSEPDTARFFSGVIDEVRVASVARGSDWIAAQAAMRSNEFMSMATPCSLRASP